MPCSSASRIDRRHRHARGEGHFFDDVQQPALERVGGVWDRRGVPPRFSATTVPPPRSWASLNRLPPPISARAATGRRRNLPAGVAGRRRLSPHRRDQLGLLRDVASTADGDEKRRHDDAPPRRAEQDHQPAGRTVADQSWHKIKIGGHGLSWATHDARETLPITRSTATDISFRTRPWGLRRSRRCRIPATRHLRCGQTCRQDTFGGKRLPVGVVRRHRVVVGLAGERHLVFGGGQLLGELGHVLIGLQIGIGLGQGEQPSQRAAERRSALPALAWRPDRPAWRRLPADRPTAWLRALMTASSVSLLMVHVALHGLDQIGNQVVTTLELHLDLREGVLEPIAERDQPVVDADAVIAQSRSNTRPRPSRTVEIRLMTRLRRVTGRTGCCPTLAAGSPRYCNAAQSSGLRVISFSLRSGLFGSVRCSSPVRVSTRSQSPMLMNAGAKHLGPRFQLDRFLDVRGGVAL